MWSCDICMLLFIMNTHNGRTKYIYIHLTTDSQTDCRLLQILPGKIRAPIAVGALLMRGMGQNPIKLLFKQCEGKSNQRCIYNFNYMK